MLIHPRHAAKTAGNADVIMPQTIAQTMSILFLSGGRRFVIFQELFSEFIGDCDGRALFAKRFQFVLNMFRAESD